MGNQPIKLSQLLLAIQRGLKKVHNGTKIALHKIYLSLHILH